jgi:hypothetical protein
MKKSWITEEEVKKIGQRFYECVDRCIDIANQSSMSAAEKRQLRIDLLAVLSEGNIKIRKLRRFTPEEVARIEKSRLKKWLTVDNRHLLCSNGTLESVK